MANIKISSLEETKISNPDASFVMVVAKDDASNLYKNYRISLTELRTIIGSIEGDIVTGVTEEQVRSIVNSAISADNLDELTSGTVEEMIERAIANIPVVEPGLSESEVQDMIDASITADNLKEHIETVVPDVIPEATIEVTSGSLETPTTVKVVEVAEKAIINEIELTKIKEVTEDCVCHEHADDCFAEIFK